MIEKEGRYQILSKIGSGGMSNVYKAWDTHLQMNVAIKEGIMDQSAEMNLLKNLKHPAIPRIIDHVNNLHHNSIVMEYVEGTTLAQWMEGKERIPVELVKQWILELCDILEYLHNNRPPILYLDLKPENIMIQEEGKLRLIDFGSVQYKYQIKKLSGTIGYAPKELINREKDKIDEQSDIYSLGMIFHYLLTGKSPTHPPFQREKVSYYQKDISPQLERVVETALSTKKTKRYQSIQEFRNAIYKSDIKQDRKKITDFFSVVFYYILVSLSAILLGIGLEGIVYENLEGYQRYFWWGCLLVTGSICWRKAILNNGVKKQKKYVIHKSILITDKKQIGLWLILVIISWSIQFCYINRGEKEKISNEMITIYDEGNRKILFQEQKVHRISSNMMFDFHDKKQNRRVIQYSINGSRWRNIMEDSFSYCIERHKKNTDCLLAIRIYNYDNHIIYELPYQLVFHS